MWILHPIALYPRFVNIHITQALSSLKFRYEDEQTDKGKIKQKNDIEKRSRKKLKILTTKFSCTK